MTDTAAPKSSGIVRAVVDFGGLALFLVTYLITRDMMKATWALVAGSAAALAVGYAFERRIAPLPLFAGLAALIFGGLTLIFHDSFFIKIKATVINLMLGTVMLGSLALKKNALKALFSTTLPLSDEGWNKLALRFGLFYLCMAGLNEIVWRTQPEHIWVAFRFPGLQVLSLIFVATQLPMLMKDAKAVEAAAHMEP